MSRFTRALLLALVAFWLPSTLHCRLEAAGLFAAHDACSTEHRVTDTASDCKDDICPTVEDTLFKESAQSLKVVAPSVALIPLFEIFTCALVAHVTVEPSLSPERFEPPLAFTVGWQFLTRAAPPARAPGLNV